MRESWYFGKWADSEAGSSAVYPTPSTRSVTTLRQASQLARRSIASGIPGLDAALGVGGIPCARVTEIMGSESTGKTTLALHLSAHAQQYGHVLFIDSDHALDPNWARCCGVDYDDLYISQPATGEEALEIALAMLCYPELGQPSPESPLSLIVFDSIRSLIPQYVLEGEPGEPLVGPQERLLRGGLIHLVPAATESGTAILMTNDRVSEASKSSQPNLRAYSAINYFSSVRIRLDRLAIVKGKDVSGDYISALVVKNRLAAPFRQAKYAISNSGEIIDEEDLPELEFRWVTPEYELPPLRDILMPQSKERNT